MNLDDYSRDFADFSSRLNKANYQAATQPRSFNESELIELRSRYRHLWSLESITELMLDARRAASVSTTTETEKRALNEFAVRACRWFVEDATSEATRELAAREQMTRVIMRNGESLAAMRVPEIIADNSDANQRHELLKRWYQAVRECDAARINRWSAANAAAQHLGFANYASLLESTAARLDIKNHESNAQRGFNNSFATTNPVTKIRETEIKEPLPQIEDEPETSPRVENYLNQIENYLTQTRESYRAQLALELRDAHRSLASATFADELFFRRAAGFDSAFTTTSFARLLSQFFAGFGIDKTKSKDLIFESENSTHACLAFAPPRDVRLLVARNQTTLENLTALFRCAGCVQVYAWTSLELARRYPQFTFSHNRLFANRNLISNKIIVEDLPEAHAGFAELFALMLQDERFLATYLFSSAIKHATQPNLNPAAISQHMRTLAKCDVRRTASLNLIRRRQQEYVDESFAAEERLAEIAEQLTEATGFVYDAATSLSFILTPADTTQDLRAQLFAVALREHLQTRYGRTWWTSKAARDELIDMWNTGARYTLSELLTLNDAGTLDFDLLIAKHRRSNNDDDNNA